MRQLIIAGNWKMHKNVCEALEFLTELRGKLGSTPVEAVVCPPFTVLAPVAEALKGSGIALGAQNMYWEKQGAYTGEISPLMLREIGCKYAILGHSERRQYFGETDESVNLSGALYLVGDRYQGVKLKECGSLPDIAPTMLDILGLPKPPEMTGESLLLKG
ncbi:triosephosphate isomerase [Desulforamulus profundi]|uniref:Triosephosphate isomerase n=1 Tax=Desulforamulus profundi TaxID=1383067 RepID=A0A2C6L2E5_9FIRM|nr:triosephosphate isomerase [Desulforamulus profundi]